MLRTAIEYVLAAAIGATVGVLLGGTPGGVLGGILGAFARLAWLSIRRPTRTVPEDALRERVRVLCVPKGEQAECVIFRDKRTGAWLDVERCALADPENGTNIRCHKKCIELLEDARAEGVTP